MSLDPQYVDRVMREFAETVVTAAKINIGPSELKQSIRYDLETYTTGSFSLEFYMNEYGLFQDQGVSGTHIKYLTRFSYSQRQPPTRALLRWVAKNRIRFRDEKGRFTRGTYKSIAFVIARSIKRRGLRPKSFFSKPFFRHFNSLPDEVVKAYAINVEKSYETWLQDVNYTGPHYSIKTK